MWTFHCNELIWNEKWTASKILLLTKSMEAFTLIWMETFTLISIEGRLGHQWIDTILPETNLKYNKTCRNAPDLLCLSLHMFQRFWHQCFKNVVQYSLHNIQACCLLSNFYIEPTISSCISSLLSQGCWLSSGRLLHYLNNAYRTWKVSSSKLCKKTLFPCIQGLITRLRREKNKGLYLTSKILNRIYI